MSQRRLTFPQGFQWGVATSAHQNEGNNINNDFWAWEQIPGKTLDNSCSGLVTDWWCSAEADFDRAAALGLNALRLSVEWSRIEPEPGQWNMAAVDRYRAMFKALRQRGMTPLVTLHHFSNPQWLAEMGGWENPVVIRYFERYVTRTASLLGDLVDHWGTINEPYIYGTLAYLTGQWPPGKRSPLALWKVTQHQIKAHIAAYQAIHRLQPGANVGIVKHMAGFDPYRDGMVGDRLIAAMMDVLANRRYLDAFVHGRFGFPLGFGLRRHDLPGSDFIGINYYGRSRLRFDWRKLHRARDMAVPAPPGAAWPYPWGEREIYPQGLYTCLMHLKRYKKPLYITEHGMADETDVIRPGFLLTHLAQLHHAIQAGADVRGYYHWTLVDNYEWSEGWTTRFGLIALDPETQARVPRRSAQLYHEVIRANAITEDMVLKYAPHVIDQVFDHADILAPAAASGMEEHIA